MLLVGDKWKILIVAYLMLGTKRYMELKENIGTISQKVLTKNLRELEENGIVIRKVYPQVPPKAEYSLTHLGESMQPIIDAMSEWGVAVSEK